MPWNITKVVRQEERVPKCPTCGGLSTVSHIVNDAFICTCGTIIFAEWVNPPKVAKLAVTVRSSHPCTNIKDGYHELESGYFCNCMCKPCVDAVYARSTRGPRHAHECECDQCVSTKTPS